MKFTLVALIAAVAVHGATLSPRGADTIVLANKGETCTLADDGFLTCEAGKKEGEVLTASAVGVQAVSEGVVKAEDDSAEKRDMSPAPVLEERFFGIFSAILRKKCAAKCAYMGYCKSTCGFLGSCKCSCPSWSFKGHHYPTCWASSCHPRWPPHWEGPGSCNTCKN